eukprot:COSAG04_NODE_12080_length_671_cov_1.258741_2_plen_70_part_01
MHSRSIRTRLSRSWRILKSGLGDRRSSRMVAGRSGAGGAPPPASAAAFLVAEFLNFVLSYSMCSSSVANR